MTTRNEAAAPGRISCAHGSSFSLETEPEGEAWGFTGITCPHGETTAGPALAAERRATVERIQLEIRLSAFAANDGKSKAYAEVLRILDEEAARG